MPEIKAAPKVVKCDCRQGRLVYLNPGLDPNFVEAKCSGCGKHHTYPANKIPVPTEPTPPQKPSDETPIPTREPDLDLSMDRDCVRIRWNGKTFTIGKIRGNEFQKFETGKGVHRETNSFGMPWALFKFLKERQVKYIKIFYAGYWHNTTVENFEAKGFFLYFKGRAEKRIYLKREFFK